MEPAIWSSYLIDLSPEEMVTTFSQAGWSKSELSDEHGAALLARGRPEVVGTQFAQFSAEHGVRFPQGHLWLTADITAENQQEVIDRLKRWLDLFAVVGVRAGVLHPGGGALRQAEADEREILTRQAAALTALSGHVRGSDFVICLENIVGSAPLAGDLRKIIDAAGGRNLGVCLDTGHLNLADGDQGRFVREAGGLLKALHLADNDGSGDQHLMPFARGTVRWAELMTALREIGYAGLFNFEIPGENRCPLPIRLAKLDYLKAAADFLLTEMPPPGEPAP